MLSLPKLLRGLFEGDRVCLARIISKIENRDNELPQIMKELFPKTGNAQVWGITGPPGAGKSTLVDQFIVHLRKQNKKVAVIAIDPSSPFSGGAILGDRIRMQQHAEDEGVYIRSLGTRGKHGGLSHSTKEVVLALDAAGFDVVLVETAGVGQTELSILRLAQTVIVVLVPESGDSIQVMKAGLMEISDVFAVNKSDRPEADKLVKELIQLVGMNPHTENSWIVPVHKTEATRGVGVKDLVSSVIQHQNFLSDSEERQKKIRAFLKEEMEDIVSEELNRDMQAYFLTQSGQENLNQLVNREVDPYSVAHQYLTKKLKK